MTGSRVRELTAAVPGAVAVVEVRGPDALSRVQGLCRGAALAPGDLRLRRLVAGDGETLDEALVWVRDTDRVELHLHGSRPLVERVTGELRGTDAPDPVPPGSLEDRARARLARALGEAEARVLLDQAEGALRRALEALLDLPDGPRREGARELAARGARLRPLFEPPRIVLRGPSNAGKSTLFNALLGTERALVDAAPGTTRDALAEPARLGDYRVELLDTAGERELAGEGGVEAAGMDLGRALSAGADLVLWVLPVGTPPDGATPPEGPRLRWLRSRADEAPPGAGAGPRVAALPDPEGARGEVARLVQGALDLDPCPWVPGRAVPFDGPERDWLARAAAGDFDPAELKGILSR